MRDRRCGGTGDAGLFGGEQLRTNRLRARNDVPLRVDQGDELN